jgi:putative ABC transport system permease protein
VDQPTSSTPSTAYKIRIGVTITTWVHLAWRSLFRNKRRTFASLCTVAFGAAGLLIYQGFNEGIMNQYRENTIRVRYGHGQVFPKGYLQKKFEEPWKVWLENALQLPQTPSAGETTETDVTTTSGAASVVSIEEKLKRIPEVQEVFPRVSFYAFLMKGGVTLAGRGEGVLSERESKFFSAMNFVAGGDLDSQGDARTGLILGKGLADSLNVKVGEPLTILAQTVNGQLNGVELAVTGIFHTGSKEFDDTFFRMELPTAQSLIDTQRVELFSLATGGVEDWPKVAAAIRETLPEVDAEPFDELDKVYYRNAVEFLDAQFAFIRSIMLLIVALGIFNTIATGLFERAGEVGALRANGESRRRVFAILSVESALLGLLGGLLGIAVAVVLNATLLAQGIPMPPGPGITRQFLIFLEIQPAHFAQALLLPAITTLLASIMPIRRLVKMSIPQLLRANL